jgi:HK97 gp10 family phage protein
MSDSITIEVKGLKELGEAFRQMPARLRGKQLGSIVKAGAEVVVRQARENARAIFKEPTGATEKSIVGYARRGNTPDDITYLVGVTMKKQYPRRRKKAASGVMGRHGRSTGGNSWSSSGPYWWRFREFGTKKEAAMPYLRPGFETQAAAVLVLIKQGLGQAVLLNARLVPKYPGTE